MNKPLNQLYDGILSRALLTAEGEFTNSPILFNETGISYNIDITIKADMTDLNEVKQALNKVGLDVISGFHEMDCIVVKNNKDIHLSGSLNK